MYNMLEILHKGKRTDTSEWVVGFLVETSEGVFIIPETDAKDIVITYTNFATVKMYQVYRNTVCSCSNLTDINDDLIYTGDILQPDKKYVASAKYMVPVIFMDGTFYAGWEGNNIEPYDFQYCECIGNVFDNPELVAKISEIRYRSRNIE